MKPNVHCYCKYENVLVIINSTLIIQFLSLIYTNYKIMDNNLLGYSVVENLLTYQRVLYCSSSLIILKQGLLLQSCKSTAICNGEYPANKNIYLFVHGSYT